MPSHWIFSVLGVQASSIDEWMQNSFLIWMKTMAGNDNHRYQYTVPLSATILGKWSSLFWRSAVCYIRSSRLYWNHTVTTIDRLVKRKWSFFKLKNTLHNITTCTKCIVVVSQIINNIVYCLLVVFCATP